VTIHDCPKARLITESLIICGRSLVFMLEYVFVSFGVTSCFISCLRVMKQLVSPRSWDDAVGLDGLQLIRSVALQREIIPLYRILLVESKLGYLLKVFPSSYVYLLFHCLSWVFQPANTTIFSSFVRICLQMHYDVGLICSLAI
jgi:hypothetical protein